MHSISFNKKISRIIIYVLLLTVIIVTVLPFVWMLSASIKTDREVFQMSPFVLIPESAKWSNYISIWSRIPLWTFIKNTMILTVTVTALQLFTSSFAAYAFAKMEFSGKKPLFMAYISTIAMPWQVYMIPQFLMMRKMGLNDTLLAMVILQAFSAFGVFLMRQFYMGIPDSLCEAARIDGMSEYGIYARIMLPLSKPSLATLTIFTFVSTWNDYLGPTIYLKTETKKTIQIGLQRFIGQYSSEYGLMMAGAVISLVPVLIVFLALQKYFVAGIATSGIKG
ncbi:carbohydrate ABC transporter permease [Blautia producta]|uniref:L-arabinose transport system permease protein AraQ n=1 Tax=Blautia producta TaxID=33035 RepID=A0A4P6M256_9FIRM|nr:carbohydrate ABC transporter permease [Blautia producta]QBE97740.1 L-arabinose transport system permease protein AraQ [Blautia producta]